MAQDNFGAGDPLAMLRNMWSLMGLNLPSMVAPTLDCDELEKRVSDLKVVEGWLSMNLSMLQMTIKSLEMQTATLRTVQSMGEMASNVAGAAGFSGNQDAGKPSSAAKEAQIWPLLLMQQLQEYTKRQAEAASDVKDEIKARNSQSVATAAAAEKHASEKKKTSK